MPRNDYAARHCEEERRRLVIARRNDEASKQVIITTMKSGFVYIITNKNTTTWYIGVTSNLLKRILEHKEKRFQNSFSARYNLNKRV